MATLEGTIVVVVGGTSGIGFGVAKAALLSRAARVIVASSTQSRIDNALARLREVLAGSPDLPGKVTGSVLDASDMSAVEAFIVGLGEFDHLVWTSGNKLRMGFKDINLETLKGEVYSKLRLQVRVEDALVDAELFVQTCSTFASGVPQQPLRRRRSGLEVLLHSPSVHPHSKVRR